MYRNSLTFECQLLAKDKHWNILWMLVCQKVYQFKGNYESTHVVKKLAKMNLCIWSMNIDIACCQVVRKVLWVVGRLLLVPQSFLISHFYWMKMMGEEVEMRLRMCAKLKL